MGSWTSRRPFPEREIDEHLARRIPGNSYNMAIEDIIDPYMVVERMISGTYQRALKGDLEAIFVMGN